MTTVRTTRVYPSCCTSAYCGKGTDSCPTCRNFETLSEFRAWVAETDAVVEDRVWCPNVYTARRTMNGGDR